MTKLSPELERMVDASRRLQGPPEGVRGRLGHAIERRVLAGATAAAVLGTSRVVAGATGKSGIASALSLGAVKVVVASAVVAAGSVAAVHFARSSHSAAAPVASGRAAPAAASAAPRAPVRVERPAESVVAPVPPPVASSHAPVLMSSGVASAAPVNLARELELVRSAQRALESGDARSALGQIDRYRKEFPKGSLAHEATTVRILALCGAERTAEGLAAADQFLREQPGSPFARRVRSACGVGDPKTTP